MENKKLEDILANAKEKSEQIIEQERLAVEAKKKEMEETQRLVHNYDTYMIKPS